MGETPGTAVREEVHQGRRILVVDLTGFGEERTRPALADAAARLRREPAGSVLLATIVKDVRFGATAAEQIRAYAAAARTALKAHAVVGITGPFARALFLTVKPFIHRSTTTFPDLPSAKAWLVQQP